MKLFSYLRKDTLGLVRKYFICLCRKKKKKTQVIPYSKQTIYQNIRSVSSHWWNLKHFIYFKPEDLGFWIWNKGRYFFFFWMLEVVADHTILGTAPGFMHSITHSVALGCYIVSKITLKSTRIQNKDLARCYHSSLYFDVLVWSYEGWEIHICKHPIVTVNKLLIESFRSLKLKNMFI